MRALRLCLLAVLMVLPLPGFAAQSEPVASSLEDVAHSVLGLAAEIPPEARTAGALGTHREGNGVVIDGEGRVLTIGYLVLEAEQVRLTRYDGKEFAAHLLGYDADSGLAIVQAIGKLDVTPIPMGDASTLDVQDPVLVLTRSGLDAARSATVVSRRTFAGYWEYLLEGAIFTVPPERDYAGAALIDRDLRLVGIGSLYVENAAAEHLPLPGNLFVPADRVKTVFTDLVEAGRPRSRPRPWLGVNVAEQFGRVIVTRVTPHGPARESGLRPGDIILEVGGHKVEDVESFYRQLWSQGEAGVEVRLKLLQRSDIVRIAVTTRDRYGHYRSPRRD